MTNRPFDPDWTVHPGATLRDWMTENGLVLGDRPLVKVAATACGRMDPDRFQRILDGRHRIGKVDAAKLQAGTGIPASFWLNMERAHRARLAAGKTWVRDE